MICSRVKPRRLFFWAVVVATLAIGCSNARRPPGAPTLVELCDTYRTDKCPFHHDYVDIYELVFGAIRHDARKVLEIGVLRGESLRLWADYFPNAWIYGLDIYDMSQHDAERITTIVADQASRTDLRRVAQRTGVELDVVIDDGGHTMEQQQISFGVLFPQLRDGGIYVIEDIHTSFPELYPGYGVAPGGRNSTYAMIQAWFAKKSFSSRYLSQEEVEVLNDQVEECFYWNRHNQWQSDLFVCRKRSRPADSL